MDCFFHISKIAQYILTIRPFYLWLSFYQEWSNLLIWNPSFFLWHVFFFSKWLFSFVSEKPFANNLSANINLIRFFIQCPFFLILPFSAYLVVFSESCPLKTIAAQIRIQAAGGRIWCEGERDKVSCIRGARMNDILASLLIYKCSNIWKIEELMNFY